MKIADKVEDKNLAPIALFVFKRPEHTKQALIALSANPEFSISPLFIYCDGVRHADEADEVERTRNLVRNWVHPAKTIIEAAKNRGLAKSIIAGVSDLSERFGRVIVVEDDLVVSHEFLGYVNAALEKYSDVLQVMQVSAYMFPIPELAEKKETLFLPNISSWGWATWARAWKYFDAEANGWESLLGNSSLRCRFNMAGAYDYSDMLLRQMNGVIDSWAIRWNWSVFRCGGLVSYPPVSLVQNTGFDGSGTHCRIDDYHDQLIAITSTELAFTMQIEVSTHDLKLVRKALMMMSGSRLIRMLKRLMSSIRRIKLRWFKRFAGNEYLD